MSKLLVRTQTDWTIVLLLTFTLQPHCTGNTRVCQIQVLTLLEFYLFVPAVCIYAASRRVGLNSEQAQVYVLKWTQSSPGTVTGGKRKAPDRRDF